jgi:hypothetical protein
MEKHMPAADAPSHATGCRNRMAERDADFERLQRMLDDRPRFPEAEVEADIAEAIALVRAGWRPDQG